MLWRRMVAGSIDLATVLLPTPLFFLYSQTFAIIWLFLTPAVFVLYLAWPRAKQGHTFGKSIMGLRLIGQGCILCRELRKSAPFLMLPFAVLIPSIPLTAIILAAAFFALLPKKHPHWDRATGFTVIRA